MSRLSNLYHFPGIFLHVMKALRTQSRFVAKYIDPILQEARYEDLSDRDVKKIRKYYGLAVPAILGEGYCILRGKPMDHNERITLSCLGAASGLYDDFFDTLKLSDEHILALTDDPREELAECVQELLFVQLYQRALLHSSSPKTIRNGAKEIFQAQVRSKKQRNTRLNEEEILSITLLKGGASLQFYRNCLSGEMYPSEKKMLYFLGGLMQLENDIFDVYKDHQDNITTLATTTDKIEHLRGTYNQLYNNTVELLTKTPFSKTNKTSFLRYINLILHRGSVCLDYLEKNEKLTEGVFSIDQYERKQLICDMEKTYNLYRVFQYYLNSPMPDIK